MVTGYISELGDWETTRDQITFKRLSVNCAGVWKLHNENRLCPSASWNRSFEAFHWSWLWCPQLILLDPSSLGAQMRQAEISVGDKAGGEGDGYPGKEGHTHPYYAVPIKLPRNHLGSRSLSPAALLSGRTT